MKHFSVSSVFEIFLYIVKFAGWKFWKIEEGFASTFQSRHPGNYMFQETYITRNFFSAKRSLTENKFLVM